VSAANPHSPFKIGVDGGGTKTELILIDAAGEIVARHLAPGCNPNIVGPAQARAVLIDALAQIHRPEVAAIHLYMSGSPDVWSEIATSLTDFGLVTTHDDSLPVLELATRGQPGLVLHGGTGSFVAARAPDDSIHYAGGLGWRFGDAGSGFDLGQRAIARALIELQGWAPATRLGPLVHHHAGIPDADVKAITRYFYQAEQPNRVIAALAPAILHLASEGDITARKLVLDSAKPLLELAKQVATKLFPATPLDRLATGLSGPILTHPEVINALTPHSPLPLVPITDAPIVGVQRLLQRT